MIHPFERHFLHRKPLDKDMLSSIGLPPSFVEFFTAMHGCWDSRKAEACIIEVLRLEGLPGGVRLVNDALSCSFADRVGDLKAVLSWMRLITSKYTIDDAQRFAWIHRGLIKGAEGVLETLKVGDGELPATPKLLSAVVMARSPNLLSFFPAANLWDPSVRAFMAEFALKEIHQNTQLRNSMQVLKEFLYTGMDTSVITTDMLNRRPILLAITLLKIKPPVDALNGVLANHRTALYKSGVFSADEAKVSAKMKRTALSLDFEL